MLYLCVKFRLNYFVKSEITEKLPGFCRVSEILKTSQFLKVQNKLLVKFFILQKMGFPDPRLHDERELSDLFLLM